MAVQTFICLDCGEAFTERLPDRARIVSRPKKRVDIPAICRDCSRVALEKFWREGGSNSLLAGLTVPVAERKRFLNRRYQRNLHHETCKAGKAQGLASNVRRPSRSPRHHLRARNETAENPLPDLEPVKKKKVSKGNLTIAETLALLRIRRDLLADALESVDKAIEELEFSEQTLAREEELA